MQESSFCFFTFAFCGKWYGKQQQNGKTTTKMRNRKPEKRFYFRQKRYENWNRNELAQIKISVIHALREMRRCVLCERQRIHVGKSSDSHNDEDYDDDDNDDISFVDICHTNRNAKLANRIATMAFAFFCSHSNQRIVGKKGFIFDFRTRFAATLESVWPETPPE